MPTYEYQCENEECEGEWEEFKSVAKRHEPEDSCPLCSSPGCLSISLPLPHVWEERAARDIITRSASKEVHTGTLPDGRPYKTVGGPPPELM